jgi:hypothetical protein
LHSPGGGGGGGGGSGVGVGVGVASSPYAVGFGSSKGHVSGESNCRFACATSYPVTSVDPPVQLMFVAPCIIVCPAKQLEPA